MDTALDDVAFLALSGNRVEILGALSDERSHTRDELMDACDVSRPTLARILDDLDDRAWIDQHGQTCRITSLGRWIHGEFAELLGTLETARQLREVERWLSADIDLSRLADAAITRPTQSDPLAPMRRAGELERTASRSRVVTHALPSPCLDAHREAVTTGTHQFQAVVTPHVVETMAKPAYAARFEEVLASEQTRVFVHDGPVPDVVGINDGVVYVGVDDDRGAPIALVETDDETVRRWAVETFESYRERSSFLPSERYAEIREGRFDSTRIAELVDVA